MEDLKPLLTSGLRYAASLTGDVATAEDLLQEAWASVIAAGGSRTKPYLFRAIKSRWIDGHRRSLVRPFDPVAEVVVPIRPVAEQRLCNHDVWRAMQAIRPEQREALYLVVVEGFTAAEAGERMEKPRNTVLSLLHRGRAALAAWFVKQEGVGA